MSLLPAIRDYDELCRAFRWRVPARYNIGIDVCDRWAAADPRRARDPHRTPTAAPTRSASAGSRTPPTGSPTCSRRTGCARGSRRRPAAADAGSRRRPCRGLQGRRGGAAARDPVRGRCTAYRLQNSGAKALVTNAQGAAKVAELRDQVPGLGLVLSVDGRGDGALGFHDTIARAASDFAAVDARR